MTVPRLVYAVRHDANLEVRERVAVALGNLGAAAGREACVQLQWIAGAPDPWIGRLTIKSTREELVEHMNYELLRRAARNAVRKIGC